MPAAELGAVRRVGIVGAGVIGGGWALHYLRMGFHLGLGEHYRAASGCGMYTAESHLCFRKSVRAGAVLTYQQEDSPVYGLDPECAAVLGWLRGGRFRGLGRAGC